ncbi:diguanylate cyclase domain-containing protein [Pseudomonas sp.]|uniref:diguanylate cyclase domain-containing protein n=1 Tax=Pseudomonas sp. TaxID=306 RepID=UPI003D1516A5
MRRHIRISPQRDLCIQVTHSRSGHPMGQIGDLSLGGLRLVARQPLVIGDSYEVVVHVPEQARRTRRIEVVVTCQWLKVDARRDSFEMGLALECPTPAFAELVQAQLSQRDTSRAFTGKSFAPGPEAFNNRSISPGARKIERQLAEALFRNAHEGIVIADAAGKILQVNPTFRRITGYSQQELRGYRLQALQSVLQSAGHHTCAWQELEQKDHCSGEFRGRHKNGSEYHSHLSVQVVRDVRNRIRHHILFLSDYSSMALRQKHLERIAHYDALTQLPNRILLAERMDQALLRSRRSGKPLAIAFIDLDGFKPINDIHDHKQGDRLLQIISARLRATLRETDTLARFGGDEFVALLADLQHPDDCQTVLERMIAAASEPLMIGDASVRLSASIGVALAPRHGETGEALIEKADQAMYRAKRAGGNRYLFSGEAAPAARPEPDAAPLSAGPAG